VVNPDDELTTGLDFLVCFVQHGDVYPCLVAFRKNHVHVVKRCGMLCYLSKGALRVGTKMCPHKPFLQMLSAGNKIFFTPSNRPYLLDVDELLTGVIASITIAYQLVPLGV